MSFSKISVIGLGYIGLPTAAILAARKISVVGVDINQDVVNIINDGKVHIVEPDLDIVVHASVTEGYLKASVTVESADAFIIAVPTPFKEDNRPDLSYIRAACEAIAPILKKGNLVVLESTSPVGTTELLLQWFKELRPDLYFPNNTELSPDIRIAYCPERVLPGRVLRELVQNDRIIGGITSECSKRAAELYNLFVTGECMLTDSRTAEMCKLTENSFRDVNIAFANELSIICDELNVNVWELIQLANRHPRVDILKPGPGVGGHCIAVDPWFIVHKTPEHAKLIKIAREVNDAKPEWVIKKTKQAIQEYLNLNPHKTPKDICIACLGIAFKADIDDLRESPALEITSKIADFGIGNVFVVEPNIDKLPSALNNRADLLPLSLALKEANIIVLLVDHKLFKDISWVEMSDKVIIDTRGIVNQNKSLVESQ